MSQNYLHKKEIFVKNCLCKEGNSDLKKPTKIKRDLKTTLLFLKTLKIS